ncbi:hypothetical protein [Archangium primigenium]|uniref:hypothetical protein n=1 Tax=[Archangium] primigenium TaxID=2792470 RepID=UPI00195F23D5|nr:hypothetical protein [Archangium primigenium]MBM7112976.1 hypothetical protein [Archangium primigenium]
MTVLPEALRPWAAHLSLFPEELALALGGAVARLAAALGPPRIRGDASGGEPQGYDGLTRRGTPDRLLVSEWLLAMEAPDEFVRRAAFGEQAYLRPAFRAPREGRRCVVLLDAGPDQLGAPRIAHLALLVVLARRAEAAGADFLWGVLQASPEEGTTPGVTAATLDTWLKRRRAEPPDEARLGAWREGLRGAGAAEEVWLVGSARLGRLRGTEGLSRVAVDEVVAPGPRRLAVEVRPARGPVRPVVLDLPPVAQCVRLLRDPFGTATAAPRSGFDSPVRSLRFSPEGLRLLLSHADGSVSVLAPPHSPRATLARPRRFLSRPDERVLAFGWRPTGGLLVLTLHAGKLRIRGQLQGRPSGLAWALEPSQFMRPRSGAPCLLMSQRDAEGRETPLLLDDGGRLVALQPEGPTPSADRVLLQSVTALTEFRGRFFFVCGTLGEDVRPERAFFTGCLGYWSRRIEDALPFEAHFMIEGLGWDEHAGPRLAWRDASGGWRLGRGSHVPEDQRLDVPAGARVVGLAHGPSESSTVGLVVLAEDQRTFQCVTAERTERLVVAPERVRSCCVSPGVPLLAWLTESGRMGVWSLQYRALVIDNPPGGTP